MLWYIRVRGIILAYLYTPGYTIDRYQNELTGEGGIEDDWQMNCLEIAWCSVKIVVMRRLH